MLGQELDVRFGRSNQSGSEKYKILFAEKLPKKIRPEVLYEIFQSFHGFVEVRQIPEKGVAFIEFANDDLAAFALQEVRE